MEKLFGRLVEAQASRPWLFLIVGLLVTAAAAAVASRLRVDSSYDALLPATSPELANVSDVRDATGGTRQVVIAIGGDDESARRRFGTRLRERLQGVEGIRRVDLEFPLEFFRDRAVWLLDDEALDELTPAVERSVELAREENNLQPLGLVWGRIGDAMEERNALAIGGDGVLGSRDGRYTFLVIVPSVNYYDAEEQTRLMVTIDRRVAELDPLGAGVEVRYAGNLAVFLDQQQNLQRDLRNAAILALILGVVLIAVFTRTTVAPLVIGLALVAGVTWTFALAYLLFGRLNVVTGFLIAVLVGLGIDFGIHIFVRYRQQAQATPAMEPDVLIRCLYGTFRPAVTSALTTAGTFFSFSFATFKGFSEFGAIAGFGVIFTLASSFLLLPPLLVLAHRPGKPTPGAGELRERWIARPIPRPAAVAVLALFAAAAVFGATQVGDLPYRNDFRRLRGASEVAAFSEYVDASLGAGFNPTVILVDSVDAARQTQGILSARRAELTDDDGESRLGNALSIVDFLPRQSATRVAQVERLRRALAEPALDGLVEGDASRAEQLALGRRIVSAEPWSVADVPEAIRQRFVALDGDHYMVYLWPPRQNVTDLEALAWEQELDRIHTLLDAAGIESRIADETLVIAWVYRLVAREGPWILGLAAVVVMLFLLVDLRSGRKMAVVVAPLLAGYMVFVGVLQLLGIELNLFNIIVLPSIIGIGIDNAVHVYHRYRAEGRGSALFVVRTTGMAAVLASLTSCVGFGSALVSSHLGIQSLGIVAVIGILSTLVAAVVFLPCLLSFLERNSRL